MAAKRAGVITIDLVGRSSKLQSETKAASAQLGQLGAAAQGAGRSIGQGMSTGAVGVRRLGDEAGRATGRVALYGNALIHVAEATTALVASHALAAAALAKTAASSAASVSTTNELVNGYRLLRIVLSPTVFTAASLATGILVEETIRLVNARARLIDQQSLFAATNKVSFAAVDTLDSVSRVSGANRGKVRGLFTGLQAQSREDPSGVQGALDSLGVSGSVGDPAVLGRIAAGFRSISDPVRQAELAVKLFGSQGGTALQQLDGEFANGAAAVEKYGIAIDELSRTQIHQFRQDLLDLKTALTDFSTQRAWWESFKTGAEIVAAAAEDMSKRGVHALDDLIGKYLPGVTSLRLALTTLTPGLAALFGKYGAAAIPGNQPLPNPVAGAAQDSTGRAQVADSLIEEAKSAKQRRDASLEGQRTIRDEAAQRANELRDRLVQNEKKAAANPNDATLLKPDEKFNLALQQKNAADLAAATGAHVQAVEAAQKAEEDALKAAQRALDSIEQYERSIREKALSPVQRIYARRDDLGFAPGSALGNRATVAANAEANQFLSEQENKGRDKTEEIFGHDTPTEHIPGSAELGLRQRQESDNRELDAVLKEWADGVVRSFRTNFDQIQKGKQEAFKIGNIDAQRTAQSGIDTNTEKRLQTEAQYASQRLHSYQEQTVYLQAIAALEAAGLELKLRAAEAELANAERLGDAEKIDEKGLELDKARLAVKTQQLETAVQQASLDAQHNTSLKEGLDSFFRDARAQAKEPGDILKDGLSSAVDGVSTQLGNLFTGKRTEWGRLFQDLGGQLAKESTKALLQQGIGKLGDILHIPTGKDKRPTGTPGDLIHVYDHSKQQPGGTSSPIGGLDLGGLFGGGDKGGGIFSLLSGGASGLGGFLGSLGSGASAATESVSSAISFGGFIPMANGGPVSPSSAYWVGEHGPEPFIPRTPGTIIPNHALGAGGNTYEYHIDARGSDVGVTNRIAQGMQITHQQAVQTAQAVSMERAKRTPTGVR